MLAACGGGVEELAPTGPGLGPVTRGTNTVIVIVLDSLRAEHLAAYGYELETTPHLATLVEEGVVFENHISVCTGANAGLASLLTGLDPAEHGVGSLRHRGQHRLPDSRDTLAEAFRSHGWATLAAVSLPQLRGDLSGLDQGFDHYLAPALEEGDRRTAEQTYFNARPELERLLREEHQVFALLHSADGGARPPAQGAAGTRFLAPHLNSFRAGRPLLGAALDRAGKHPEQALEEVAQLLARGRGSAVYAAYRRAGYDSRLAFQDHHLGELFNLLRDTDRWDDALVVVTTTRGALLAPPRGPGTPAFPPELVRTPLLVRFPGGTPRGRIEALTSTLDLAPTLSELFDWPGLGGTAARSLLGPVETGVAPPRAVLCSAPSFERRAAFGSTLHLEQNPVGGALLFRADSTWVARPGVLEGPEAAEFELLTEALEASSHPAGLQVDSGGRVALEVRWRFGAGYPGPAFVETQTEAPESEQARRPARVTGLGGSVQLPAEVCRLVIEGSRRELPLRVDLDFGDEATDEEHVWAGDLPLADCLLPRLPSRGAPAWPVREDGTREPCEASLESQGSKWWRLAVGEERGDAGRPVEIFVILYPPAAFDELLEYDAGVEVEVLRVPGRRDALFLRGATPLTVNLAKSPRRDFGLAVRIEGRVLPGDAVRLRERTFGEPGELALYLPDWVPGLTEVLERDPVGTLPPEVVRIGRRGSVQAVADRWPMTGPQLTFARRLGNAE